MTKSKAPRKKKEPHPENIVIQHKMEATAFGFLSPPFSGQASPHSTLAFVGDGRTLTSRGIGRGGVTLALDAVLNDAQTCVESAIVVARRPQLTCVVVDSALSTSSLLATGLSNPSPLQNEVRRWIHSTSISSSSNEISSSVILASSNRPDRPPSPDEMQSSVILASSNGPERPPSPDEIQTLQKAFAAFYGAERDTKLANDLFTQTIDVWERTMQSADETAGLYRVRGDVNMELFQPMKAESDYGTAIQLLQGPDGSKADPEELPASLIGRARAIRSLGSSATKRQALQASTDYETYFSLTSRLDDNDDLSKKGDANTFSAAIVDGVSRNPYATWEWGMVSRVAEQFDRASEIHRLASNSFRDIGDIPRSVISDLDRGIDLAAGLESSNKDFAKKLATVQKILEDSIESDVNVQGRDIELLQRLVGKEGEARTALAGLLWSSNQKAAAEAQYGTACSRLDELNADYQARESDRIKRGAPPPLKPRGASLGFSIDDLPGADEASCSRFKNDKYVDEKLVWNAGLREKVRKFLSLGR